MKTHTQAGKLNTFCELQRPNNAQDESGQPIPDWQPVASVWISIDAVSGREVTRGNQVTPIETHEVWMRHRTDVSVQWRIKLKDNRTLQLSSVADPDNRRRWLVCRCIEVPS